MNLLQTTCCLVFLGMLTNACYYPLDEIEYSHHQPTIVIEGALTDDGYPTCVCLHWSQPFSDTLPAVSVQNAEVEISSSDGQKVLLTMTEPGKYCSDEIVGRTNVHYYLNVRVDEKQFKARSTLLPVATIDSLTTTEYKLTPYGAGKGHVVKVYANRRHLFDTVSFYRVKIYENGQLHNHFEDIILFDDEWVSSINGVELPYVFQPRDTVLVKVYSIEQPVYSYYRSILELVYGGYLNQQGVLYEPVTNITGGALGYFQASAVIRDSIVIPEN